MGLFGKKSPAKKEISRMEKEITKLEAEVRTDDEMLRLHADMLQSTLLTIQENVGKYNEIASNALNAKHAIPSLNEDCTNFVKVQSTVKDELAKLGDPKSKELNADQMNKHLNKHHALREGNQQLNKIELGQEQAQMLATHVETYGHSISEKQSAINAYSGKINEYREVVKQEHSKSKTTTSTVPPPPVSAHIAQNTTSTPGCQAPLTSPQPQLSGPKATNIRLNSS